MVTIVHLFILVNTCVHKRATTTSFYRLSENIGSVRTVDYVADDHNGFNAIVHKTVPHAAKVIAAPAPLHYAPAAPLLSHYR